MATILNAVVKLSSQGTVLSVKRINIQAINNNNPTAIAVNGKICFIGVCITGSSFLPEAPLTTSPNRIYRLKDSKY